MTAIIIIAAILLFSALVLLIRVKIVVEYEGSDVKLVLKLLGIPFTLMPKNKKKKKIKLSDYSRRAIEKRRKKEAKRAERESRKPQKEKKPKPPKEKAPLSETISFISDLVLYLIKKFFGYLRIDMTRIVIRVGSDDAAKTAISFGIINGGVFALLSVLDKVTNVKKNRRTEISVSPDFTSDKITSDIKLAFSVRVYEVISLALGALFRYLKQMFKKQSKA